MPKTFQVIGQALSKEVESLKRKIEHTKSNFKVGLGDFWTRHS